MFRANVSFTKPQSSATSNAKDIRSEPPNTQRARMTPARQSARMIPHQFNGVDLDPTFDAGYRYANPQGEFCANMPRRRATRRARRECGGQLVPKYRVGIKAGSELLYLRFKLPTNPSIHQKCRARCRPKQDTARWDIRRRSTAINTRQAGHGAHQSYDASRGTPS